MENQIKLRSRAVELRWSSDKCQESDTGHTINKELQTLEFLDQHNFEKCDSGNSLDSLYHKIFPGTPQREGAEVPLGDEPVILLLCSWAVCPQRSGEHRAFVAAHLLERRMIELDDEKFYDQDQMDNKNVVMTQESPPIFQKILQDFLDVHAPVADENSSPEEKRSLSRLILLFSQLIQNEVFSLDTYMCLLIARGNLTDSVPLRVPSDQDVDGQRKSSNKEVKDEVDDSKEDSSDRSDDYDMFDKPPPAPAPPQEMGTQENPSYQSFQQKFVMETQKYESNSDVYDDDQDSQESEDQEKDEDSRSPSPQLPKINRHLIYAKHFPLPQGELSTHEVNQRLLLLYGYGKARKEVRNYVRGVKKDVIHLLGEQQPPVSTELSKESSESSQGEKKMDLGRDRAILKLKQLPYFDQHILTTAAAKHVLDRVQNCKKPDSLPSLEQVICLLDLLEDALNIHGMLEFLLKLLESIKDLLKDLQKEKLPENYTTNVCLCIVGVLRKYQACLLVSTEQTATIFQLLCGVVKHVNNVTNCTSAERCIHAYLYDLYMSCSFLKVKFSDMFSSVASKVKEKLYTNIQPSESNLKWNENYMQERIENPKSRQFNLSSIGKQLSENSVNRYSFVCNALIAICNTRSMERICDLSILCAELTASCNGLISEWLGVLRALCCSSNHGCGFTDLLCEVDKVDVSDTSIHDKIAMFTAILIARHCFSLDDVVEHVAMASLIAATPSFSVQTDTDAEPGARLMCHLLIRLFCSLSVATSGQSEEWINVLSSCDRHLLEAAHRRISVEPLVGVLKALLLIGDSGEDGNGSSLFDTADDMAQEEASPLGNRSDHSSLRTYAKYTLKTICAQECVREICLTEPERLLTNEVLLDQLLSPKQMHFLLHLICYPNGVPSVGVKTADNEQKQTIERILKTLDQWTLRISLLELQLMLKQSSSQTDSALLDNISKATMEVFHHQQTGGKSSKSSKASRRKQEQERNSIWLVAPLIAKLPSNVQGRVLRSAGTILESVGQTWTAKPATKDSKQEKRTSSSQQMSLASPQPLLSLVLTCLKGQDDQKEGLLTSLQTQLTQFLQTPKDDRWDDPKSHQLMHEALQLRLSLVGNMFDTIMRSNTWTTEFALLLLQLITSGPIDVKSTPELFTTVLDMMNVLVNSTLSTDLSASPGPGDESKQHQQLIKKLKKELGDKRSEGIDRMRQLLPVPRRTVEVLTCEPMGSLIDTKGNKVVGFDSIKKQGLQVSSKQKIPPWELLELPKNQGPLSWSWFGAVRIERKPLPYHEQYRRSLSHSHYRQQPDDFFLNPPVLPPDEEEAPQPIPEPEKEIVEAHTPKQATEGTLKPSMDGDRKPAKKRKKKQKQTRDQPMNFPPGNLPGTFAETTFHQPPMFPPSSSVPYQQPLPPAGPLRPERPATTGGRQALRNLLTKQNPAQMPGYAGPPMMQNRDDMRKHHVDHQQRIMNMPNPGMFHQSAAPMQHMGQGQQSQVFNRGFQNPMLPSNQMGGNRPPSAGAGNMVGNYPGYPNQHQNMMPGMRHQAPNARRNYIGHNLPTPTNAILQHRIREKSLRMMAGNQGLPNQHQGASRQQAYNMPQQQQQAPPQQPQHPDQQRLLQLQQQQQLMQRQQQQQPNMNLMQQLQTPTIMQGRPQNTMTPPRAGNFPY